MELPIIPSTTAKKDSDKTYLIPAVLFECIKDTEFSLLVDLIIGDIILDPQNDRRVTIPDLSQFSANELKVLQAAVELGNFSKDELNAKAELDPVMTQHFFNFLLKRGFFTYAGDQYSVTGSFNIIFNPEKLCFDGKVVLTGINYNLKLKPKIQPQDLKKKLSRYINIKHFRECWIVSHKAEK